MDEIILTKAIHSLRPDSEFVFTNGDYATIQWHKLEGDAPSKKQIDDEITAIKLGQRKIETDKTEAKASAQAKLAALGLTADEIAALGN